MKLFLPNTTTDRSSVQTVANNRSSEMARPTREEVARLAFELYELRSRADGNDVDDWLRAESVLRHHYA
jgi:hypothetical protein